MSDTTTSSADGVLQEIQHLKTKLDGKQLPEELQTRVDQLLHRLERMAQLANYSEEFERTSHYIDWLSSIPWTEKSQDTLDIENAKQIFEAHHFGMVEVKERFFEYLSVLILNAQKMENRVLRAPVLLLHGLVGTGKTTFAYSLAEAMGRTIVRIPFGGLSSARDLRGQSRLHPDAEPGYIIKSLVQSKVRNPVILLDEIDRVSDETRGEIMGVLVELLDPEQNSSYTDHYIDFPIDLSEAVFIATCNNTDKIATAVIDRLEIITMPSYSDQEKIEIGRRYLLPKAMKDAGLTQEQLVIDETLWAQVVRPLGFDAGIRTLQRTIQGMVRKAAKQIVESNQQQIRVTAENVQTYLPTY